MYETQMSWILVKCVQMALYVEREQGNDYAILRIRRMIVFDLDMLEVKFVTHKSVVYRQVVRGLRLY